MSIPDEVHIEALRALFGGVGGFAAILAPYLYFSQRQRLGPGAAKFRAFAAGFLFIGAFVGAAMLIWGPHVVAKR